MFKLKFSLPLLLLLISLGCFAQDKKWELIWADEFDGDRFDSEVWSKIPRARSDWSRNMSDFDSLYVVRDGVLTLRGVENTTQKQDTSAYLTGGLYTKHKKYFQNGRLEIKAKFDCAQGAWPAIWMLPEVGRWPDAGEIDIMEHLNFDTVAHQTLHTRYTKSVDKRNPKSNAITPINKDDFNIYAVELYKDSISLYINDQHTLTYPRIETEQWGQFPFSESDFYLLIDMQLGGEWVGEIEPEDLPVEMHVDWVRFYTAGN